MNVYFDNAASTLVRDEAIDIMVEVMRKQYGNPSSTHHMGRQAAGLLETSRKNIAGALNADSEHIYFTSGGTEANNWAVLGAAEAQARKGRHIITSTIEHDAVMDSVKKLERLGWETTYLMPDKKGRISFGSFADALREDTALASIMLVNNETGAVNPVNEYAQEIKRRKFKTLLHTDAVQAFCKTDISVKSLGADLIAVSAHKIHGPKGVGALYVRSGINFPPALLGGMQEHGKRPGTEALPAIVAFGEAARLGHMELTHTSQAVQTLRDHAVLRLKNDIPEAVLIGDGDSPYLLSLSLPGYKSEVLMSFLDSEGICVSKSSACKKGARSRVLESMQLKNDIIDGAIRVSFSRYNTIEEVEYFATVLKRASETIFKTL
ncbi:MAG: cysteine desulfurase [Oscillospiraceae bacterium]|nr:cysteine desulfurase [Oscillospiraceae bacterium]